MQASNFNPLVDSIAAPKMNAQADFPVSTQFGFRLPENLARNFRAQMDGDEVKMSPLLRDLVEGYMRGEFVPGQMKSADDEPRTFTAPYVGAIPCGPWNPTEPGHERFTVSTEVADELEARDGDWWFRAAGDSMIGAGILDGSLVLVRPYDGKPPRRGDVVAVQIADEGGEVSGTFKRFDGQNGDVPKLLDGNDDVFDLPDGARVAAVLARGVGVVSRL